MKKEKKVKEEVNENNESVEDVMKRLQKKYGDDISVIDTDPKVSGLKVIPTGSFGLDYAFDCGGIPKGRMIELFGGEGSGKTTLALFLIGQVQKQGGKTAFIDAEHCYDPEHTACLGVDVKSMETIQPASLDIAMDTLRALVETNQFDLIVLDSVASMPTIDEIEAESDKQFYAIQARRLGQALKVLVSFVARSKTTVIFINQLRSKVGIVYGNPETTPGGAALKYYSSLRVQVSSGTRIKDKNDIQIGNEMKIKMVKNKVGFPFKQTSLDLYYQTGIDLKADALDFGEQVGVIKKTGNTYSFGDITLGVSREKAIKTITEDVKLFEDIKKKITEENGK